MRHNFRRIPAAPEADGRGEGPFISFTDLLSGIVLMFLLMIALLLMRQEGAVNEIKTQANDQKPSEINKSIIPDLQREIAELKTSNNDLIKKDAETIERLAASQNALERMKSDLRDRPRFRPAMAINWYKRSIHDGEKAQTYFKTEVLYVSDDNATWFAVVSKDKGNYAHVPATAGTADQYKTVPIYNFVNGTCTRFNRSERFQDCNDGHRIVLARDGNKYVGFITHKGAGFNYYWEVTWEIITFYDDFFR